MAAVLLLILTVAVMLYATLYGVRGHWAIVDERGAAAKSVRDTESAIDRFWAPYADLAGTPIGALDFHEAGWSKARTRAFLDQHFPGREEIRLDELKPLTSDDVMVRDVVRYRHLRYRAAERFSPIRFTWINVEDEEQAGHLPAELLRFVTSQERQSGRLVLATDLLPFVGRPLVYELLEKKLEQAGLAPTSATRH
jgi:hypothetical protein